ncbi:cyanobactin maturation protease PatG family protein [Streptomyces tsukubensis]|uniref:cyanobactin maturation protease PatG family protein n=1 Tax=Streptomyces tsukubensis TaxID=83656 RepID=UPI003687CFB6
MTDDDAPVPEDVLRQRQPAYVYAIGRIGCRFPDPGVEKEFAQAAGRADTRGRTDAEALHTVLDLPENRYLVRQLLYVFSVRGVETYTVRPRWPEDFDRLVEAVRPQPTPLDLDVLIGVREPVTPGGCGGHHLPLVEFEQLYSFDRTDLVNAVEKPKDMPAKRFRRTADEVLTKLLAVAENAGATAEDRAANYLTCRYAAVYVKAFEAFAADSALTSIDVRPAAVGGDRGVVSFTLSFTQRGTDLTERWSALVDTHCLYPYLLTPLAPSL